MKHTYFGMNITSLCRDDHTFASICRELGINRQQFNKYKSGQHIPSRRNMSLIASHFSVSEKDLFLDPASFNRIYGSRGSSLSRVADRGSYFKTYDESLNRTAERMKDVLGVHLRYQVSSIYRDSLVRSVHRFYTSEGLLFHDYIERFGSLDAKGAGKFTFRYRGLSNFLDGRLYLVDVESKQQNEHTFAILTPIARKPLEFMFGIASGVAAGAMRGVFATRVALQKIDSGSLRPSHVRKASILDLGSDEVPAEIRDYLGITGEGLGCMIRGS